MQSAIEFEMVATLAGSASIFMGKYKNPDPELGADGDGDDDWDGTWRFLEVLCI